MAIIPRFSSILSAYGMALSDVTVDLQDAVHATLQSSGNKGLQGHVDSLTKRAVSALKDQGFTDDFINVEVFFNCHFAQATTNLMIKLQPGLDLVKAFHDKHHELFGFILHGRDVLVDSVRVRGVGLGPSSETTTPYAELATIPLTLFQGDCKKHNVYFEKVGWQTSRLIALDDLSPGHQVLGPAIIFDKTQTILVEPDFIATTLSKHVILDKRDDGLLAKKGSGITGIDLVQLSVFSHRYVCVHAASAN
ncbi:hypothetical protein EMMF5_000433 [Cystobasidiomycetes sp. EMM_F5]